MTAPTNPTTSHPTSSRVLVSKAEVISMDKLSLSSCSCSSSSGPVAIATSLITSSTAEPTSKNRRIARFSEDPVSDVFIVNRVDSKYNLELFYQPEDFTLFRHERNMEIREEMERNINAQRQRQFPKRDSMDLRSNQLQSRGERQLLQRRPSNDTGVAPARITRRTRCSMDMSRASSTNNNASRSPIRRPTRPCSRSNSASRSTANRSGRGSRPMALAA